MPSPAEPIDFNRYISWQGWASNSKTVTKVSTVSQSTLSLNSTTSAAASVQALVSPTSSAPSTAASDSAATQTGQVTPLVTSLSGYVFLDIDRDGKMLTSHWALPDALVALYRDEQPSTPWMTTTTRVDGSYSFAAELLTGGSYSLGLLTYCHVGGIPSIGKLLDENGKLVTSGLGTPGGDDYDRIDGIHLEPGYTGTNYNFAEFGFPPGLVSKRMLIGDAPLQHTTPEPGSLVLLAVSGLLLGGLAAFRLRSRKRT